jgi:hypothetical protein
MFTSLPHSYIIEAIQWLLLRFSKHHQQFRRLGFSSIKDDPSAIFLSLESILSICVFDVHHAIFFFRPVLSPSDPRHS